MEFRLQPAQGEIAAAEDGSASDIAICRLKPELQRKDEALCPAGFLMEHLRIHLGDADTARQIRECVRSLMPITDQLHAAETACSEEFTRKFAVTESADRVVDWLPLSEDVFVMRATRLIATSRLKPELQREERFSGMTYLRGQADFDKRDWEWFQDLIHRNRRACGTDSDRKQSAIEKKYHEVVAILRADRDRFEALDAAIDRIVWQLVGLAPDGGLPNGD